MEPITISVHFTEQEYIRLNYVMSYRHPLVKAMSILGVVLPAILLPVIYSQPQNTLTRVFDTVFPLLPGIYFLIIFPIRIRFRSRRIYRKTPQAFRLIYTFDAEGFRTESGKRSLETSWKQVLSIRQIASWYLICTGPKDAHYIPAGSFASQEQEKQFRALLRSAGRPLRLVSKT